MDLAEIGECAGAGEGIGEHVTSVKNSRIPQSGIAGRAMEVRHPRPYHLVIDVNGHIVRVKIGWLDVRSSTSIS